MNVVGLFAGIGGIELGLQRAGLESILLNEIMPEAQAVLRARFDEVDLVPDVRELRSLPREAQVVVGGFPCTDISQAGRTAGIRGAQSGLIGEAFRLVRRRFPTWLVLENVSFLLQLGRGAGMRHLTTELEDMKMRWAYRVVDSRFTGVPQRRRRVLLVASRSEDPRSVLFGDDAGERPARDYASDAFGFYWTEGLRGLGWAQDAVPTLKGGSTVGIPSPPAVWVPNGEPGRRLVKPNITDGEVLQGFPRGWTEPGLVGSRDQRWKLVGNAVTVGVAEWIGSRLVAPTAPLAEGEPVERWSGSWPTAGWGEKGRTFDMSKLSEFPVHRDYVHLLDVIDHEHAEPLSQRGAAGFLERTRRAKLRFVPDFINAVENHVQHGRRQLTLLSA